jgi:DnaJ-domain-containing protein 1
MVLGQCKAFNKLKRYQEAINACNRGMDIPEDRHPKLDRISTLLARADAHEGRDDIEESVRDCERALHLDKDHAESRERTERAKRLAKKSKMKDYYKVLDVARDADDRAIKKAYKVKALALHPDKVCGAGQCKTKEESDRANKQFHEVAEAYEVLSDPDKKAKFDNGEDPLHEQPQQGGGGFPFGGFGGGGSHFTFHFG